MNVHEDDRIFLMRQWWNKQREHYTYYEYSSHSEQRMFKDREGLVGPPSFERDFGPQPPPPEKPDCWEVGQPYQEWIVFSSRKLSR